MGEEETVTPPAEGGEATPETTPETDAAPASEEGQG